MSREAIESKHVRWESEVTYGMTIKNLDWQ